MRLPGRLSATTLGDLLGVVYRARATGTLVLEELEGPTSGRRHSVHVKEGLVVEVDSCLLAPLGEILVHCGDVPAETVRLGLAAQAIDTGQRLGEWLCTFGNVDGRVVVAALERQMRDRINALFALREARVLFRVPRPLDRRRDFPRPLQPLEFLRGRPRARDRRERCGGAAGALRTDPVRSRCLGVLGLPETAGIADIRNAFRMLAAHCHPDRHPEATSGERRQLLGRFAELSQAYHVLMA